MIDEALRQAIALMTEQGVGGLTVPEVARRMGIRGPSLSKSFPSRHGMSDAPFARGLAEEIAAAEAAIEGLDRGVPRLRAAAIAIVHWAVGCRWLGGATGPVVYRGHDRRNAVHAGMRTTLERLPAAAGATVTSD